jgi:DNA-binding CsgD family transcriptional regulator
MLVDRDEEIATLSALLRDCSQGNGTVVVIRGPVASGKTALLRAFTEQAEAGGATILSAVASRAERTLSMNIPDQLFRAAGLPAAVATQAADLMTNCPTPTAHPQQAGPTAAGRLSGQESTVTSVAARLFEGLLKLLAEMSGHGPVVIAVDDLQYADVTSLQFLSYLARRASGSRILIVLTEGTQALPADKLLHAEILRQGNCHSIPLALLLPSSMASLLRGHFNGHSQRLASACHTMTGGNPLLADALAKDSRLLGIEPEARLVPRTAFRSAIVTCLHRYEPWVVELAQAVAVLDGGATGWLLAELLEITPEAAARGLDALGASGLLRSGQFRHEAARQAVLDSMTTEERSVMHGRAARALYRVGTPSAVLARHLVAAERIGAPWVVPVLRDAADQALADGDADSATGYLRRAEIECIDQRQQAAVRFALACAEWSTDPECAARYLAELTAAALAGLLDSECMVELAFHLLWVGEPDKAGEVLAGLDSARARTTLGSSGLPARHTTIRSPLDFLRPGLARRIRPGRGVAPSGAGAAHSAAVRPGPAAIRPGPRPPAGRPQPSGLDNDSEATLAAAEKVLQERGVSGTALASVTTALMTLICENMLDRASFWCDVLLRDSGGPRGGPMWRAVVTALWAVVDARQGNLPAAEEHARTALTMLPAKAWGVAIGVPLSSLLFAATASQKHDDAAEYLRKPVPEAMFGTPFGLLYLYARGDYYLATGRAQAALADFTECGNRMTAWALDHPGLVPWRAKAAEAHLRLGNPTKARTLSQEQLAQVGSRCCRARGIALRGLALTSHPSKRAVLLRESAEVLRDSGARLELAHTFTELSNAHLALGEVERAQWAARQARSLADRCGIKTPESELAQPDAQQRESGKWVDKTRLDQLSDAERRVAILAAYGYTNCQISSKLFITVSTVEQHLTRVYRKLGVAGRVELPIEI